MKKILYTLVIGLSVITVQSQEISDAMRYAQSNLNGTARFRAMAGAFGALGGDMSSLNVNPAGSVVFNNSQVQGSLSNYNTKNNSDYLGTKNSENNNAFDLNQGGGVFIFENEDKKSDWKKFALGLNYENANNFDNRTFSSGTNQNSISNYFLSYANPNANQGGIFLSTLENFDYDELNFADQQAFLGYQAYIINPTNPNDSSNDTYFSNVNGGSYKQENGFSSKGYNGKLTINGAGQYKDWLNVGLNLNSHFTDYRQTTIFFEGNSSNSGVRNLRFRNEIYTYGTGFSFQIGAIAKATKQIRVGLSYESPTWYRLNDETSQILSSTGFGYGNPANPNLSNVVVNPQITNVYEPYTLQTPGKYTGSLAYIFGKNGLLSVDFSTKDYSNTQFRPKNEFTKVNKNMSNVLTRSNEVRIGGEYKIKFLSLRGGYRYEQSPYKDKKTIGDLTGYSGGLGYNFGDTKVDLSYSYSKRNARQQFFSQGFTDFTTINAIDNNVTVTVSFEL